MSNKVVVDIKKLATITCPCGCEDFTPVFNIKLLPPLLSPNNTQEFIPIQRWKCNACGELIPVDYKRPVMQKG